MPKAGVEALHKLGNPQGNGVPMWWQETRVGYFSQCLIKAINEKGVLLQEAQEKATREWEM